MKDTIGELLTDWHHWLGWFIIALAITVVFAWFKAIDSLREAFWLLIGTLVLIVIFDIFNHKFKLQ